MASFLYFRFLRRANTILLEPSVYRTILTNIILVSPLLVHEYYPRLTGLSA